MLYLDVMYSIMKNITLLKNTNKISIKIDVWLRISKTIIINYSYTSIFNLYN